MLPLENPGTGMASEKINVRHDNNPAVKEAGELQALEAAELEQRPQL